MSSKTLFSCLFALAACAGPAKDPSPLAALDPSFAHLLARYDMDENGTLVPAEYEGASFGRLDRDGDGLLTPRDFARAGRRVRGLRYEDAVRSRAEFLLAGYFQDDEDGLRLDSKELLRALAAYDVDADGRVGRREFEARAERRSAFGIVPAGRLVGLLEIETTDPWERLVLGVDGNDDGFLTAEELTAFFHARGTEEVWHFEEETSARPRGTLVGLDAPDFTLSTPDGLRRVTLSSFAGERPVALIFGSYT